MDEGPEDIGVMNKRLDLIQRIPEVCRRSDRQQRQTLLEDPGVGALIDG